MSTFQFAISRFESSRPSQAVQRLETLPSVTSETPANGGLLRIGYRSPGSQIGRCGSEIADSLRRIFEIFPFLGDCDRRPGSIGLRGRVCSVTRQILQCRPFVGGVYRLEEQNGHAHRVKGDIWCGAGSVTEIFQAVFHQNSSSASAD